MAAAYKATLILSPINTTEKTGHDRIGKFPGNFPSTADDEREANSLKEAQRNQDASEFKRELVFEPDRRTHEIGRASSNPSRGLVPGKFNGYFFSPVMSRIHATVKMRRQKLYIEDRGSMHGTFHNGNHIKEAERVELKTGDLLSFGTQITRGDEVYNPKAFECEVSWEPIQPSVLLHRIESPHVNEGNRRRSCGYGVTDEDLIVSENEMELDWSSDRDGDETNDEASDSQETENELEPYSDGSDEYDEYEDDEYRYETEETTTSSAQPVDTAVVAGPQKQSLDKAQPEEEKVESIATTAPEGDSKGKKWQNLVMDVSSNPATKQEPEKPALKAKESDLGKPRVNRFSIGSLMNEVGANHDTAITTESSVSDCEVEELWMPRTKINQSGQPAQSGSKLAPISLLDDTDNGVDDDDDMASEGDFDIASDVDAGECKKAQSGVNYLLHKGSESEDEEPPEQAGVKGDEEARKTHWASSGQEVPLPMGPSPAQESKPSQGISTNKPTHLPLPSPLLQNGSNNDGNRGAPPSASILVRNPEPLNVLLETTVKRVHSVIADHWQAQQSQQTQAGQTQSSVDSSTEAWKRASYQTEISERLKQYFAARHANAAILAGSNPDRFRSVPTFPTFHAARPENTINTAPAPSPQTQHVPWAQRCSASHENDGQLPYGLFPIIQPLRKEERTTARAPSPQIVITGEASGKVKKPNIYEQILSSDETKAKRAVVDRMKADLEKMKANFQDYVDQRAGWREVADESVLGDAPHSCGLAEEMEEDLDDTHVDVRTDVSEAGSNATSMERRNVSLMQELNDAALEDCESNSDFGTCVPTSAKVREGPTPRCPISSLVNQQPAETGTVEVFVSNCPEIHELDVTTSGSRKRKFDDADADQKEVVEEEHPISAEVPKGATADGIVTDVAAMNITTPENNASEEPSRKRQRSWPTIATSFALGAAMGGVGVFAALVASAPS